MFPEFTPSMIDSMETLIAKTEFPSTYVVSFSENGDALGQWRGYCPNGKGYSLGFDSKQLYKAQPDEWILAPCVYKKEEHKKLIALIIKETLGSNVRTADDTQRMLNTLMVRLRYIAPLIKNEAFADEQEWRLIRHSVKGESSVIQYRERNGALLPYVSFFLESEGTLIFPVTELIIGPTHHKELSLEAANGFKEQSKLGIGDVKSSNIPYQAV
jgi:hypothetical protein